MDQDEKTGLLSDKHTEDVSSGIYDSVSELTEAQGIIIKLPDGTF